MISAPRPPCDPLQPQPCTDLFCEVCIFRCSLPSPEQESEREEGGTISPTQLVLDSAATSPAKALARGVVFYSMPCVHHSIAEPVDIGVVSDSDDVMPPAPKTPKREPGEIDAGVTPAKAKKLAKSSSAEPPNADRLSFLRDMKAQQDDAANQLDQMRKKQDETASHMDRTYRLFEQRLDNHDGELLRVNHAFSDLNDKVDNLELGTTAQPDPRIEERLRSMEKEIGRRLLLLEQETMKKGPPAEQARGPSPLSPGETDTVVVCGVKRDTPKGQITKAYELISQSRIEQRFGDLSSREVYCSYLLPSVIFIRCPNASLARQTVSFLRGVSRWGRTTSRCGPHCWRPRSRRTGPDD